MANLKLSLNAFSPNPRPISTIFPSTSILPPSEPRGPSASSISSKTSRTPCKSFTEPFVSCIRPFSLWTSNFEEVAASSEGGGSGSVDSHSTARSHASSASSFSASKIGTGSVTVDIV